MTIPVIRRLTPLLILILAVLAMSPAHAAPQASFVMDMRDGKVLYARSADRKLHPASLTKMMTLYITFDQVRRGKLRLDQKLRVSRHAARQPASKLYLRAGQRVTVRSLIRATALKSANDAAMVLAEGIGGSQKRFAQMMTRQAQRLGMKNTRFRNPHGLTQSGHYSTARDMALLGRHLFHDFPQYYNIFSRKSDSAAGKRVWNTNRMLSSYKGADGIKTGYTRAAGYNLVASAHRGQKRILAVLFGGRSSADRSRKVARLLDMGFARAKSRVRTLRPSKVETRQASTTQRTRSGKAILVSRSPRPAPRPTLEASVLAAVQAVLAQPARAATGDARLIAPSAAPNRAQRPVPRGGAGGRAAPSGNKLPTPGALARVPLPPPRPVRIAQRGGKV